ncbi:hypothetical protein F0562_023574 [Nyssa sinensis]|uniref:Uncharacterized protein n=1 Tax=Nyssa sinensis TaxID=561372 RepID=A0A5J5BJ47_9ASTE|nr:hypothetical protein F0562_023574 [Nyssa sinensis]
MTADTTTSSYWLNWRVLLSAIWVLMSMVFASILISKYEGPHKSKQGISEDQKEPAGVLYDDEHILLLYSVDLCTDHHLFRAWIFALQCMDATNITIKLEKTRNNKENFDAELGTHAFPTNAENSNASNAAKCLGPNREPHVRQTAGFWGYVFQIIFQMNAGAVMLTDCVFWFIIVPFLEIKDYNLNFLIINMHTINAVFLFGDTALNCLRFSWFRIAYFFLWTAAYVIFQWIVHACISLWWPYPFLDLSSLFAPVCYSSVTLMHIPCYGVFALVMKMKHFLLSTWFPRSYQCRK